MEYLNQKQHVSSRCNKNVVYLDSLIKVIIMNVLSDEIRLHDDKNETASSDNDAT